MIEDTTADKQAYPKAYKLGSMSTKVTNPIQKDRQYPQLKGFLGKLLKVFLQNSIIV